MKYLTYVFFMLLGHTISSQLSIRNNAFIYVNNEVIFVDDNLNLSEIDSKIYLRNESQLLQGVGITGNSGLGNLTVFQTGQANNYMFNYWGSPVGNPSVNSGNDSFRISLIDDPVDNITSNDALFTSNVNGISSPLTISSRWLYTHIPIGGSYSDWQVLNTNSDIAPGIGFTMKGTTGSGSAQIYDFRGKPNNGTIDIEVLPYYWTLVGNPYPSALDTVSFIYDTENANAITGTLYFWEQDPTSDSHNLVDYRGGYATFTINSDGSMPSFVSATYNTYNTDGSLNTSGSNSTSGKQVHRYLPIGQGFMVEGSPTSTGTLKFKNAHRVYYKESDPNSQFFRSNNINTSENITSEGFPIVPDHTKRFRLYIDFDGIYTRELLMNFHPDATDDYDFGFEGTSPGGVTTDAFWLTETNMLVIQAKSYNQDSKIPLGLYVNSDQTIVLSIKDVQNFDNDTPIYIYDKYEGILTNLKTDIYSVNLATGYYSDRFEIVFNNQPILSDNEIELNTIGIIQINTQNELAVFNPKKMRVSSIDIFDIKGSEIYSENYNSNDSEYRIPTSNLNTGIYVAKVVFGNSQIATRKVVVRN